MEQFSPEIYIVYAQGWEGSFDVHGGKSWDLKWAVTKQSVLGVIDREPLDNPKQMKELEQALFFAVKNFGHSEQITKFGAHKMMDSLMLYVDAGTLLRDCVTDILWNMSPGTCTNLSYQH